MPDTEVDVLLLSSFTATPGGTFYYLIIQFIEEEVEVIQSMLLAELNFGTGCCGSITMLSIITADWGALGSPHAPRSRGSWEASNKSVKAGSYTQTPMITHTHVQLLCPAPTPASGSRGAGLTWPITRLAKIQLTS